MLSKPPTTTVSLLPSWMDCDPNTIDFMPEEHTLLMVVQVVEMGRPPRMAAWRAGAWPTPAESTLPRITYCTSAGFNLMDSRAAVMQWPASSGPERPASLPM